MLGLCEECEGLLHDVCCYGCKTLMLGVCERVREIGA
jgi:hypothetical protein